MASIILIILILFGFFAYKEMNDYTNIIKLNWWIEIPKEIKYQEIYSKDSWESFHWDWIRYHIYFYENEEAVDKMLDWENSLSDDQDSNWGYFEHLEERLLVELKIEWENFPPLAQISNVYYKKHEDNSEILILLNDIQKKLYVIESFL